MNPRISAITLKLKSFTPWLVMGLVLIGMALLGAKTPAPPAPPPQSPEQLLAKAQDGKGRTLLLQGVPASAAQADQRVWSVAVLDNGAGDTSVTTLLINWGPTLLLVAVLGYMARKRRTANQAGGAGLLAVGKSKAKLMTVGSSTLTFADVAGCDEAKQEVSELVDFLREPKRFENLGGRIPRGVLLEGPPGTGKTRLAQAIAGEAGVPFFSISGSDFVEMLVGVGASRVRDLFRVAKAQAPCIVFIDEIDAVGRHRGTGQGGGSDEREQTLNQLLVEMDGFEPGAGVIILAATNRVDSLDAALLRPGRFDRQVNVGLPDVRGREQILQVHLRKVPVAADLDVEMLAKGTPGFSGADLANLVNEGALSAAKLNKTHVGMAELERAKDKLLMGSERHSMRMSEQEKSVTAYHEAGHTLVAKLLAHTDPIHKVSIIPRGRALGVTVQLPAADRYSLGKKRIKDSIAILFGGRVAEELYTGDVTTGASNDYERATQLAKSMVTQWGMSESIGPRVVSGTNNSPETMAAVDAEIRSVLTTEYTRVSELLAAHAGAIHALHDALMEHETLDAAQVDAILALHPR